MWQRGSSHPALPPLHLTLWLLCFEMSERQNYFRFGHNNPCKIYTLNLTVYETSHSYNHSVLNCQGSAYLHRDQCLVHSLFLHQFIVCAELYNIPVLESSDYVSIADSGQTMGHYDGRSAKSHLHHTHVQSFSIQVYFTLVITY